MGSGSEEAALAPFRVRKAGLEELVHSVVQVALGQDHTVVLTSQGTIFTFGSNEFGQLGYDVEGTTKEIPVQLAPKKVASLRNVRVHGIAASRVHSIAFSDTTIYAWGWNQGQFGILSGEVLSFLFV